MEDFVTTTVRVPLALHQEAAVRLSRNRGKFQSLFLALLKQWLSGERTIVVERTVRTKPEPPPLPPEFRALRSILEGRNNTAKRAVSALLRALDPASFKEQHGQSHSDETTELADDLARGIEAAEDILAEAARTDAPGAAAQREDHEAVGSGRKRGTRTVPGLRQSKPR